MAAFEVIDAEPAGTDVVAKLQEVMDLALDVRLSSIALVVVHPDGTPQFFWSDAPSKGLLIGGVARLQAALIGQVDGK